jgi:hypothetical protein
MKKKVDTRIRTLIENCVHTNQRSFFVIVGDKGRDQVRHNDAFSFRSRDKDRQLALYPLEDGSQSKTFGTLVLQEGTRVLQSLQEANAPEEKATTRRPHSAR